MVRACGTMGGGGRTGAHSFMVRRSEGKRSLEDKCIDRRIILKWIFMKLHGEAWTVLYGLDRDG